MLISSNYALPFILITIKWILIPLALMSFSFTLSYGITKHRTPWSPARITSKKLGLELSGETSKSIGSGSISCKFSKLCLGETNQATKRNLVKHTSLDQAGRSFDYMHSSKSISFSNPKDLVISSIMDRLEFYMPAPSHDWSK